MNIDPYGFPEGALAVCRQCGEDIMLDQTEGGGTGKDWGSDVKGAQFFGGLGMDYGCPDSPDTDDESTYSKGECSNER